VFVAVVEHDVQSRQVVLLLFGEAGCFSHEPSVSGPDTRIDALYVLSEVFADGVFSWRQYFREGFPVVGAIFIYYYPFELSEQLPHRLRIPAAAGVAQYLIRFRAVGVQQPIFPFLFLANIAPHLVNLNRLIVPVGRADFNLVSLPAQVIQDTPPTYPEQLPDIPHTAVALQKPHYQLFYGRVSPFAAVLRQKLLPTSLAQQVLGTVPFLPVLYYLAALAVGAVYLDENLAHSIS